MAVRQKTRPNLSAPGRRGWCLEYIDNSLNARYRQPTAQASWNLENRNGNTRTGQPPLQVWVPIYFSFGTGIYKEFGHVAWAYRRPDGSVDVVDTEVRSGARKNYNSINEVIQWFSAYNPKYLGWTYWQSGIQVAENYTPKPVITTKEETKTAQVPFIMREEKDPTLAEGTRKVIQKGVAGLRTIVYTVTYTDGKETSRKVKSEGITREPIDEVVAVGTQVSLNPIEGESAKTWIERLLLWVVEQLGKFKYRG